ncbi:hypothetical protein BS329_09550 [Amycolatopsis coloradensis]|uniref:Helix-turn-helix domain-containing protein n=2 Tax=Amycolatopsis coloradensis TaxID=76021 RepID=A0A1R0KVU6_9PSEU|nr:hypothetical protein BS329_09550 [Amycolatopsis coloradensis]
MRGCGRHAGDAPETHTATAAVSSQLWSLGVTTDLMTAARVLGVGRTTAYRLAREGTFPVPLKRVGRNYRVVVARLAEFLGLDEEPHG